MNVLVSGVWQRCADRLFEQRNWPDRETMKHMNRLKVAFESVGLVYRQSLGVEFFLDEPNGKFTIQKRDRFLLP